MTYFILVMSINFFYIATHGIQLNGQASLTSPQVRDFQWEFDQRKPGAGEETAGKGGDWLYRYI